VSNNFKGEMLVLADDLVANPNTGFASIEFPVLTSLFSPDDGLTMVTVAALASAVSTLQPPQALLFCPLGQSCLPSGFSMFTKTHLTIVNCPRSYIIVRVKGVPFFWAVGKLKQ